MARRRTAVTSPARTRVRATQGWLREQGVASVGTGEMLILRPWRAANQAALDELRTRLTPGGKPGELVGRDRGEYPVRRHASRSYERPRSSPSCRPPPSPPRSAPVWQVMILVTSNDRYHRHDAGRTGHSGARQRQRRRLRTFQLGGRETAPPTSNTVRQAACPLRRAASMAGADARRIAHAGLPRRALRARREIGEGTSVVQRIVIARALCGGGFASL